MMSLLAIEAGHHRIAHLLRHRLDKGPVSRTLALMQKRGLIAIRTDPRDGRKPSISLTPKGRQVHDQVIVAALERERRLLACLRKDERKS